MREKQYKITIIQIDSHWEAVVLDNSIRGGWYPILFGYGTTEEEATTNLMKLLLP